MLLWDRQGRHPIDTEGPGAANVELFLIMDVSDYCNRTMAQCLHSIGTCIYTYVCMYSLHEGAHHHD